MSIAIAERERATLGDVGLRELRQARVLSQRELAKKAGVATKTIVDVEAGSIRPQPRTIRKLAEALDMEPAALAAELRQPRLFDR